ncbi:hypothetical protein PAECIP111893_05281 [Paenibacillus plantiphilus]|uniref:DUF1904 family protein n=1 Tax=Paenibacillus plantiphilus TaxID=2905650 RepID=A0ABN8H871_9BACL|nr:DUF1904 family protein [Paenibacillus plantiphilus]CAH1225628.1 hypothetical protein PAECIP111893_05281 [Paenibacillus plantiphilus]
MPQLLVRGIDSEAMARISRSLVTELAEICECGADNFTIDCLAAQSVYDGELVPTYPFIEVGWFERGSLVRDRFAAALTRHVLSLGIAEVELAFKVYQESAYYINGKPCHS